jgi:uncharacterized protein (TIGR00251 family)
VFAVSSNKMGISFPVKVQPGASRTSVVGVEGDFLKVRLAAPPVEGKANQALIEVLAEKLEVPKSCVRIRSGLSSRKKVIDVASCSEQRFRDFLSILERSLVGQRRLRIRPSRRVAKKSGEQCGQTCSPDC